MCKKQYFSKNRKYFIIGAIFSTASIVAIYANFLFHINWLEFFIGALTIINFIFFFLLPACSTHGRKIMDEIEGLKMYLETTEKNLLEMLTSYASPNDRYPLN